MPLSKVKVIATLPTLVGNQVTLNDAQLPRGGHEVLSVRELGEEFLIPAVLLHDAVSKGFTLASVGAAAGVLPGHQHSITDAQRAYAASPEGMAAHGTSSYVNPNAARTVPDENQRRALVQDQTAEAGQRRAIERVPNDSVTTPPLSQAELAESQQEQPRSYLGTLGENKSGETLEGDAVGSTSITNRTKLDQTNANG